MSRFAINRRSALAAMGGAAALSLVGQRARSPGCSEKTFGHSCATGTLTWADPACDTICVVPSPRWSGCLRSAS